MALANILKDAVKDAVGGTLAEEIREIVAKETRRTLREREEEMTELARTAVVSAVSEMLNVQPRQ